MTIYVGNLSYKVSEEEVTELFADFGAVKSVNIIRDNASGRSKGFAFVEMENDADAEAAIEALNETEFSERNIIVNKARPKSEDSRGGGRGRHQGGGGGNRRRY